MSDWIEAAERATTGLGYEASSEAWAFLDGVRGRVRDDYGHGDGGVAGLVVRGARG